MKFRILQKKLFTGFGILEPGNYEKDCSQEQINYLANLPKSVGYIIQEKRGKK